MRIRLEPFLSFFCSLSLPSFLSLLFQAVFILGFGCWISFGNWTMSIALESTNRIEGSGFIGGMSCISIFDSSESGTKMAGILPGDRRYPMSSSNLGIEKEEEESSSSSCSSSIGRNSDCSVRSSLSDGGDESGETEVQSTFKGPLETMDSLEESLPIRRGISKFYCGKSKSFTSLADVSSAAKDLAKPENSFNRKRKNLVSCSSYNNILDRNRNYPLRNTFGGISKRPANSSRSTLALAVAMSSSESNMSEEPRLPPLYPQGKSTVNTSPPQRSFSSRSFSLTDLSGASVNSTMGSKDKFKKFH